MTDFGSRKWLLDTTLANTNGFPQIIHQNVGICIAYQNSQHTFLHLHNFYEIWSFKSHLPPMRFASRIKTTEPNTKSAISQTLIKINTKFKKCNREQNDVVKMMNKRRWLISVNFILKIEVRNKQGWQSRGQLCFDLTLKDAGKTIWKKYLNETKTKKRGKAMSLLFLAQKQQMLKNIYMYINKKIPSTLTRRPHTNKIQIPFKQMLSLSHTNTCNLHITHKQDLINFHSLSLCHIMHTQLWNLQRTIPIILIIEIRKGHLFLQCTVVTSI